MSISKQNQGIKARLRNGSETQSQTARASGSLTDEMSSVLAVKPIDEEVFKKADTDKKLGMMAEALNKLCVTCESFSAKIEKIETLEQKIDGKLEPLWEAVFDEDVGLKKVVTKLQEDFYKEDEGVQAKVQSLEESANFVSKNYDDLLKELDTIKYEQEILRGYATKHEDQISALQDKTVDIVAKSMENNISISGIQETDGENCIETIKVFLEEELRITGLDSGELYKIKQAFRIGSAHPTKPRLMIVKCNAFLRKKILEAAKEYKERQGRNPLKYHVSLQLPDKLAEQNRFVRHIIWEQKKKDEGLPFDKKAKILVQNNLVYINKKLIKRKLPKIKPHHMFQDKEVQEKLDAFEFISSETKFARNSIFQAHVAKCTKSTEAHLAQVKIRQTYPEATHVITAFDPAPGTDQQYAIQDDGEHGAALKLLRLLQEKNYTDVVVCVTRIYGGYHLGPKRFEIILEKAQEALDKFTNE